MDDAEISEEVMRRKPELSAQLLAGEWEKVATELQLLFRPSTRIEGHSIDQLLGWANKPFGAELLPNHDSAPDRGMDSYIRQRSTGDVVVKSIRGDGSCQFRAISHKLFGSECAHEILRLLAKNFMQAHDAEYLDMSGAARDDLKERHPHLGVTGADGEDEEAVADFQRFLACIVDSPEFVFGEDCMLTALGRALHIVFHVVQIIDGQDSRVRVMFSEVGPEMGQPAVVHLALRHVHYEALILSDGFVSEGVLRAQHKARSKKCYKRAKLDGGTRRELEGELEAEEVTLSAHHAAHRVNDVAPDDADMIEWRSQADGDLVRRPRSQCFSYDEEEGDGKKSRVHLHKDEKGADIKLKVTTFPGGRIQQQVMRDFGFAASRRRPANRKAASIPSRAQPIASDTQVQRRPAHEARMTHDDWAEMFTTISPGSALDAAVEFTFGILEDIESKTKLSTLGEEMGGPILNLCRSYQNKQELLCALVQEYNNDVAENVVQIVGGEGVGKSKAINAIILRMMSFPPASEHDAQMEVLEPVTCPSGEVFDDSRIPVSADKETFEDVRATALANKKLKSTIATGILPSFAVRGEMSRCTPCTTVVHFTGDAEYAGSLELQVTYFKKREIFDLLAAVKTGVLMQSGVLDASEDCGAMNNFVFQLGRAAAACNISDHKVKAIEAGQLTAEQAQEFVDTSLCIPQRYVPLLGTVQKFKATHVTDGNSQDASLHIKQLIQLQLEFGHWGLIKKIELFVPCGEKKPFAIHDSPGVGDLVMDRYCQQRLQDDLSRAQFSTLWHCVHPNRGVQGNFGDVMADSGVLDKYLTDPFKFHICSTLAVDFYAQEDRKNGQEEAEYFTDEAMEDEQKLAAAVGYVVQDRANVQHFGEHLNALDGSMRFCNYLSYALIDRIEDFTIKIFQKPTTNRADSGNVASNPSDAERMAMHKKQKIEDVKQAGTIHRRLVDVTGELFSKCKSNDGNFHADREPYSVDSLIESFHANHQSIRDRKDTQFICRLMERCMIPLLDMLNVDDGREAKAGQQDRLKRLSSGIRDINMLESAQLSARRASPHTEQQETLNPSEQYFALNKRSEIYKILVELAKKCDKSSFDKRKMNARYARYTKPRTQELRGDMRAIRDLGVEQACLTDLPRLMLEPLLGNAPGAITESLQQTCNQMIGNLHAKVKKLITDNLQGQSDFNDGLVQSNLMSKVDNIVKVNMKITMDSILGHEALRTKLHSTKLLGKELIPTFKSILNNAQDNKKTLSMLSEACEVIAGRVAENLWESLRRDIIKTHEAALKAMQMTCQEEITRASAADKDIEYDEYNDQLVALEYVWKCQYFRTQLAAIISAVLDVKGIPIPGEILSRRDEIQRLHLKSEVLSYQAFVQKLSAHEKKVQEHTLSRSDGGLKMPVEEEEEEAPESIFGDDDTDWACANCGAGSKSGLGCTKKYKQAGAYICNPCFCYKKKNGTDRPRSNQIAHENRMKKDSEQRAAGLKSPSYSKKRAAPETDYTPQKANMKQRLDRFEVRETTKHKLKKLFDSALRGKDELFTKNLMMARKLPASNKLLTECIIHICGLLPDLDLAKKNLRVVFHKFVGARPSWANRLFKNTFCIPPILKDAGVTESEMIEELQFGADVDNTPCRKCGGKKDCGKILMCEFEFEEGMCDHMLHTYCCEPKLEEVPSGKWYCPEHAGSADLAKPSSSSPLPSVPRPPRGGSEDEDVPAAKKPKVTDGSKPAPKE
mmetsp:Transcript_34306/g.86283  ORF Transcript_34306/g.86283 Transcript_34306/m.86283 type:complete len:1727 (-) Transcript_34306:390-5570(-)